MLPRWPTNVFYNTINPEQLEDEYNYIFYERYLVRLRPGSLHDSGRHLHAAHL